MIENLTNENIDLLNNTFLEKEEVEHEFNINPYARYLIYVEDENIIGYLYYSDIYERTEINMIEVKKDKRNQHIASKLITKFLNITNKPSTLEVRKSNIIAINLYKKYGYKEVAIRKNYYNFEDGILMEKLK